MNNKDKITEVTFALSLNEGFDNVSMKEIQEASGFSAGSIYYYFKDKNEILVAIFNKYILEEFSLFKENIKNLNGSFIEKLNFIFTHRTTFFNEKEIQSNGLDVSELRYKNYLALTMSIYHEYPEIRNMFHEMHNDFNDFYQELIQEAIEKDEIRDDIDIKILAILIQSSLRGYLNLWMTQSEFSFEELVENNINMIWESIKKK